MIGRKHLLVAVAIAASFAAGAYAQGFPNLRRAQANLQEAAEFLERAPPGFGGHKRQAILHIRAAFEEIDRAMEFAMERREEGRGDPRFERR